MRHECDLRSAFEFTKRKFVGIYGPDLPVWALLTSGATGGVRIRDVIPFSSLLTIRHIQIAYWLSCYPLGISPISTE
jgi:solute carrier family 25 carnitine/acylcarnitine transporter 20/29